MRSTFLWAPIIALAAMGCDKDDSSAENAPPSVGAIVGKWKVDQDFIKAHSDIKPTGFMTSFAQSFWYDLKADKSFQSSMSEGHYSMSGTTVTITTRRLLGQDVANIPGNGGKPVEMTGELSNGGKTLTLHPPDNGLLPAELKDGIKMAKESGS